MDKKQRALTVALLSTWIFGFASGFFLKTGLNSVSTVRPRMSTAEAAPSDIHDRYLRACGADSDRLCAHVAPGEGRKHRCLAANVEKISVACRELLPSLH